MRKLSIKLSLIAAVLAFGCLYQSPVQAQDKEEIEADGGEIAERRAEERQRLEDALKKERGEDGTEEEAPVKTPETPDQDAVQMGEAQAAGGCSFSPAQTASRDSATYAFAWGAAIFALIIRQRKKA